MNRINNSTMPPSFGLGVEEEAVVITKREYVTDVFSSINFVNRQLPISPSSTSLFPWLSGIAKQFEQYRFLGLAFEFKSTSADALNSTNTALGTIGLVTQYDATEPTFYNKQQFEAYQGAQVTKPSESILHLVECAPGTTVLNKLYVQNDSNANEDPRFQQLGVLNLMTRGMQVDNANIGELWVTYHIRLSKPKLNMFGTNTPSMSYWPQVVSSSTNPYGAGTTTGIGSLKATMSNLGVLTFSKDNPNGNYLVVTVWKGTGATTETFVTPTITGGGTFKNLFSTNGSTVGDTYYAAAGFGNSTPNRIMVVSFTANNIYSDAVLSLNQTGAAGLVNTMIYSNPNAVSAEAPLSDPLKFVVDSFGIKYKLVKEDEDSLAIRVNEQEHDSYEEIPPLYRQLGQIE
jgi:hypothetical protein